MPDHFEITDTLGQLIITARLDNALIMVQKIPNTGEGAVNIQDKDELTSIYTGF